MYRARKSNLLGKITILLIICCCCLSAQAKYGSGTGEPNDPFLIYTAEQMNAIGADSNDWDKHFLLCADIDLSAYTGTSFNIIGSNWDNPFNGVFDGNGHTISNFSYTCTDGNNIGLFGYTKGTIKDLGLINPDVDAGEGRFVGSLAGWFKYGTIENCYVDGASIAGAEGVGGLVGQNGFCYHAGECGGGTISNCYSTGIVAGYSAVGGLVGMSNGGTISNCYSDSIVSGTTDVGGLLGLNDEGTISNSYSNSDVSGEEFVGGLVGLNSYMSTVSNSYSSGSVSGDDDAGGLAGANYGEVSICFWDIESSGQTTSAGGTGKTTAEMQKANTFVAWACDPVWTIDEGADYPRLAWENALGDPITIPSDLYSGGSGEPNDPYLIYTAEQLNSIGLFPCHLDKHFKLMADIDLRRFDGKEGREKFNVIGKPYYGTRWIDHPFSGVFDGGSHTISNFIYESNDTDYTGLFGVVYGDNAEIKDLRLIDPKVAVEMGRFVGSLVGMLNSATIANCDVKDGTVTGSSSVGCFSGYNYWGTITNCSSTGSIAGETSVGGLTGYNRGTITKCYAEGSVTGKQYVGGMAGNNSHWGTITNCYSTGSVLGSREVGGLVGINGWCDVWRCYSGTISNCYSTGSVDGNDIVGGLVGWNEIGEVMTSFWDIETSGQSISDGGTGLSTDEMQMQITFTDAGWDFNTPVWTIDEGVDYPCLWWEYVPILHAEPEVTLGTGNTIFWEPVVSAVEYYAECAEDENFTSIVYNSGWIKETSCEFTGLHPGQQYWYSVKARNSAYIESRWSNVEYSLQCNLAHAVDMLLDQESMKNENLKNVLLKKIDEAIVMIEEANYTGALSKLENDILTKMNGCDKIGEPDNNDWIITCEEQNKVYPLVIETIEYVRTLLQ